MEYLVQIKLIETRGNYIPTFKSINKIRTSIGTNEEGVKRIADIVASFLNAYQTIFNSLSI